MTKLQAVQSSVITSKLADIHSLSIKNEIVFSDILQGVGFYSLIISASITVLGILLLVALSLFNLLPLFISIAKLISIPRLIIFCFLILAFAETGKAQSQIFNISGNFTVPAGVTSITVELWGGGGGGAIVNGAAGGGGGGAYTKVSLSGLTPGALIPVTVGAGGAPDSDGGPSAIGSISANGGHAGNSLTGGAGGAASAIGGNVIASFAGGTGGNAMTTTSDTDNEGGGGGGGSALSTASGSDGETAISVTGGAGGTGAGVGGRGANGDGTLDAVSGTAPGGGGGGRGEKDITSSKAGAAGQVIISWNCPANAGVVSGASRICASGGTTTFTSTVKGGTWTSSNSSYADIHPLSGLVTAQTDGAGKTVTITYTVASVDCPNPPVTKDLIIDPLLTIGTASGSPTLCVNTPMLTSITHTTSGATGIGIATGLPAGITAVWNDNTITISGTPTEDGTFNYSILVTATCGDSYATGKIIVNPSPTLTGATQVASVCEGSGAIINLTGLLKNSTSTIDYKINGIAQPAATGIVADGSGIASFITGALTAADNGQTLQITGITITSATPFCSKTFNVDITLKVDPASKGGTVTPANLNICSGDVPANLTLTANIGDEIKWQKANDATFTTPIDIPVTTTTLQGTTIGSLTTTTYFRAVVKSGTCPPVNSDIVIVNVNPLPTATITGNNTICAGSSTNLSVALTGTQPWSVTYTDGTTPVTIPNITTSPYSFSVSPSSTKTYTLTAVSDANLCIGTKYTGSVEIIVNPIPIVNVPAPLTYCNTQTTSPISFTGGVSGTVYNWTNDTPGIGLAASGTGNIAAFTAINIGSSTVTASIRVTPVYTNAGVSCIGTEKTFTITVNPTPTVVAAPASPIICSGQSTSITLTSNVSGTTFDWTVVQSGVSGATGGSGNSIVQALMATGNAQGTVTYKIIPKANVCTGAETSVTIIVSPIPVVPTCNNVDVCYNSAATLTASGASAGYNYKWYNQASGGTPVKTSTDNSDNTYITGNLTSSTNYWVSVVNANNCESPRKQILVTVQSAATTEGSIKVSQTICYNDPVSILNNVSGTAGGGTRSYEWEQSTDGGLNWVPINGAVADSYGPINLTVTTHFRRRTISRFNAIVCPSGYTNTVIITVQPQLIGGSITGNQTICGGQSYTITGTASMSVGSISYRWEVSTDGGVTWSDASLPNNTQNYTPAQSLSATTQFRRIVYFTNSPSCSASSNSVTVTVNPMPVKPVLSASATAVCEGTAVTITATSSNATTYTLKYINDGSGIYTTPPADISNTTGIFTVTPIVGKHKYTVTATNGSCSSTSDPIEIKVYDIPILSTTESVITSCTSNNDGFILVTYQLDNGNFLPGEQVVEFSFDNGITWSTVPYISGLTAGVYNVMVRNHPPSSPIPNCTNSMQVTITLQTIQATNMTICQGDKNTLNRTLSAQTFCFATASSDMNYSAIPLASSTYYVAKNPIVYNADSPSPNPLYVKGPLVRYFTFNFSVEFDDKYDLTAILGSNPDNRVAIYKFPFVPSNPEINLLGMDDTAGGGSNLQGDFNDITLHANTNYVIVVSYLNETLPTGNKDIIKVHLGNNHGKKFVQTAPTPPVWYKKNADGTYTYITQGSTFDPLAWPSSGLTTTDVPGVYPFYVGCESGECKQPALLTINPIPYPRASGNPVNCSDIASDITLSSTMSPTNSIISPPEKVIYTWTARLVSGNPALVSGFSDCLSGTCGYKIIQPVRNIGTDPAVILYTIYAQVGDCKNPVPTTFELTVNPLPAFTVGPLTQTICPGSDITPIVVTPTNAVSNLTYRWSRDNSSILYPGIPTIGTGAGTGFSITGKLPSALPQQSQSTVFIIEALVNGYPCASKTVTVTVVDDTPPTIICPSALNLDCADNIPPKAMNYADFILQPNAAASDNCTLQSVTWVSDVKVGAGCNYTITRTYKATDMSGRSATCTQLINVSDNMKPTWLTFPISQRDYCVQNIVNASWNLLDEPGTDIVNNVDNTPVRPDYYILNAGDYNTLYLNPATYFRDNCTPAANLKLHWSLATMATGAFVTDTKGNLLDDETDALNNHSIKLDGNERNEVNYTLEYWLEDDCGNISDRYGANQKIVYITIHPRPYMEKKY